MSSPTPARRLAALAIDAALICLLLLALSTQTLPDLTYVFDLLNPALDPHASALVTEAAATTLIYYTIFDGVFPATPGKALMGLRLLTTRYHRPLSPEAAFKRTITGGLDVVLLTFALLPILSSSGRTIGDRFTHSVVLRRHPARLTTTEPGRGPGYSPHDLPAYTEADRARRDAGLLAEREVAASLMDLQQLGYILLRNLSHRAFGDIDLCLVGPGGVYVVEVKSHRGAVTGDPYTGELLRDGEPFEKDFHEQVGRQVEFLLSYLFKGWSNPPLLAMICMPNATLRPNALGELPEIVADQYVVHQFIASSPPALTPSQSRRLENADDSSGRPTSRSSSNPHHHSREREHRFGRRGVA